MEKLEEGLAAQRAFKGINQVLCCFIPDQPAKTEPRRKSGNSNARRKQATAKIRNRRSTVFQIFSIRLGSIIKRNKDYNTKLDNYKKINDA
jgi:hypothetical protein